MRALASVRALAAAGLVLGLMASCTVETRGPAFDGTYFRASAKKDGKDRSIFGVTVRPVSASLAGARDAGAFAATRYCIEHFGSSDVIWSKGPEAAEEDLDISGNVLRFSGRCAAL